MKAFMGLQTNRRVDLAKLSADPDETAPSEEDAIQELQALAGSIAGYQQKLKAAGSDALLIVLQGMDGSGKDGTVRHVLGGVNPAGCNVYNFRAPTEEELSHDFLWRAHAIVPPRGHIGVFNRSYYEDVVVVRVHADRLLPPHLRRFKDPWDHRYRQIEHFERLLVESSTHVLKFFLHIDKGVQKDRFLKRQKNPDKQFKLSRADIEERKHWKKYMEVYGEVLRKTTFKFAPWTIIPANQKWYRNLIVARAIEARLRKIDPQIPRNADKALLKMKIT